MSKSPLFAISLATAAFVVGGAAWMLSGDESVETAASVVDLPEARTGPRVMALTPHERRLKGRLEASKRKIEEYRKQGKVLENGTIVVPDVDGSPLYIHPKLIEGVGRYGEPLYAMARYKRRAGVPVNHKIEAKMPANMQPKMVDLRDKKILTFGTKPGEDDGPSLSGDGADGGGGGPKGGKGAPTGGQEGANQGGDG